MGRDTLLIRILGGLVTAVGFLTTLLFALLLLMPLVKHIPISDFLVEQGLGKDDCMALILSPLGLFFLNVAFSAAVWAAGLGLLFLQDWGRKLFFTLAAVELLWMCGDLALTQKTFGTRNIVEPIVWLALSGYFLLPKVRAKYKGTPA